MTHDALSRPAEYRESSRLVVWNGEIPDRRPDAHVSENPVISRARIHELFRNVADAGIRKVDRNPYRRRIAVLHGETRVERAERQLLVADHQLVRESRRVELECIRIVNIQEHVERSAGQADARNTEILERDDGLLEPAETKRRASRQTRERSNQSNEISPAHPSSLPLLRNIRSCIVRSGFVTLR